MALRKDGELDQRAFSSKVNAQLAGRPKLFASKLREAIIRRAEEGAEELSAVLYNKALTGDVPAVKEMMDRALGKALQNVDVTTNGKDLPVPILTLNAVRTDDSDGEGNETLEAHTSDSGGNISE